MSTIECVALYRALQDAAGHRLISKSFISAKAVLSWPDKVWQGHMPQIFCKLHLNFSLDAFTR